MNIKIENLPGGRFYTTGDGIVTVHKSYRKSFGYRIKHKSIRNGNDIYDIACKEDIHTTIEIALSKSTTIRIDLVNSWYK